MKNIFTLILLALATFCAAQSNQVKTPGVSYSAGAPNWVPVVKTASELAIDTVAKRMYLWNRNTGAWDLQGQGIDNTSGGTPPAYTPGQTDSKFAINNASPPELYAWTGSAWAKVGGTIQTIDTFSVSGSVVSLSLSQDNQPAKTITLPASGITSLTGDVTATGPGSAVATIAAGAVTGAKLASGAVSDSTKMGANVIEQSNIDNGAVWARHIARMGASSGQVLGWNGSVWGPTAAGVSGSGTTGFLPKFSSSTGLTNSAFDENTNGYITSTTRGITVGDAVSSSAAGNGFRLLRGTLSGGYFSNGSQLIFQTTSNHDLYFATNATERIRIQADGDVGVGTNNPSEKLHVVAGNFQIDAGRRHKWSDGSYMEGGGTSSLFTVRSLGNVLINGVNTSIGTDVSPTSKLDITGANGHSQFRLRTTYTPTSTADALGNPGDIAIDANYFYVKTAAGWKRAALSTF